ncbi:nucleoside 2-deoxyribosyltransferase, partial [Enterococcus faecalis]
YLNLYTVGLIKLNGRVVSSEEDVLEEIKQRLS